MIDAGEIAVDVALEGVAPRHARSVEGQSVTREGVIAPTVPLTFLLPQGPLTRALSRKGGEGFEVCDSLTHDD
jgi:hypothetical protein